MGLLRLLAERKKTIIDQWFERVVDTYPADTARFLKKQKDIFANPVGSTTRESLSNAFEELIKSDFDSRKLLPVLDPVIRIRAVQAMFTPSQAVAFPFDLKRIIRKELQKELGDMEMLKALAEFELRIDELSLTAFNIYMKCRETVFQMKANHEKNKIYSAFVRAGLVEEIPEEKPELDV